MKARMPLITPYYLATPLFALVDWLWGVNVRIVALDDYPAMKYGYYALCLGCGFLTCVRPALAPVVGLGESSLNIVLLVLGMLFPYFRVSRAILEGHSVVNPYHPGMFVNFAISGVVLYLALRRSERALGLDRL